jgi:hypothetical protein
MDVLLVYPCLFFALLSFCLALHHLYKHSQGSSDKAREESCSLCCYLQLSDMKNHEIWVVCSLCISITWFAAYTLGKAN